MYLPITEEMIHAATEALRNSGVIQFGRCTEVIEVAAVEAIEAALAELPELCQMGNPCTRGRDLEHLKRRDALLAELGIR